jgi:uncharacterized protein involved in tellurium resistance
METPKLKDNKLVKFDSTINLGHVLTFFGFILTGFGAWSSIDRRLTVLEESRRVQAQIDQNQDERVNQAMGQIKESLGDIRRNLEKVSDRLDKR